MEAVLVANRRTAIQPATSPACLPNTLMADFADVLADVGEQPLQPAPAESNAGKTEAVSLTGPANQVASPKNRSPQTGADKQGKLVDNRGTARDASAVRRRSARPQTAAPAPLAPFPGAFAPPAPAALPLAVIKSAETSPPRAASPRAVQMISSTIQDTSEPTVALPTAAVAGAPQGNEPVAVSMTSDRVDQGAGQLVADAGGPAIPLLAAKAEATTRSEGPPDARRAAAAEDPHDSAVGASASTPTGVVCDEHGGLSVHLSLPHIGALELKITGDETGSTSLNISAEREGTLRALIGDQAQLHAILKEGGIQPEGRTIEFSLMPPSSDASDSRSGSGSNGDPGHHRGGSADLEGEPGVTASGSEAIALGRRQSRADTRSLNLIDITA